MLTVFNFSTVLPRVFYIFQKIKKMEKEILKEGTGKTPKPGDTAQW